MLHRWSIVVVGMFTIVGIASSGGDEVKVETAATVCFLEGPAVDAAGNVFFSDIAGNRIMKMDPQGQLSVFRADSGRTNGNCFDNQGRLISCEGGEQGVGRRRIVETDMKTGEIFVLTEKYDGKRYNSPNDLCIDSRGRIWFTDPYYGLDRSKLEMDVEGVYRIDPASVYSLELARRNEERALKLQKIDPRYITADELDKLKQAVLTLTKAAVRRVLTQKEVQRPNGIAISPDDKTLYVIDSHPKPGGNRKIWAFDVAKDGSLANQKLVYDFGKGRGGDGMKLDMDGNLWVAAGISVSRGPGETLDNPPGVYIISPKGKLIQRIPIPENLITNLAFGGPEHKTLYVTAGKTVYKMQTKVSGYTLYPPLAK